uniref:Uncharacterized protein n=1 Tax=Burkholderia phage vB_BgluM-SURPRISE13 TaxID=3159457 RepID=A0AAU7PFH3_9VIRU
MPYNEKQRRLFRAAAHDKDIAERHHMTEDQARKLMDEDKKITTGEIKNKGKKK